MAKSLTMSSNIAKPMVVIRITSMSKYLPQSSFSNINTTTNIVEAYTTICIRMAL